MKVRIGLTVLTWISRGLRQDAAAWEFAALGVLSGVSSMFWKFTWFVFA